MDNLINIGCPQSGALIINIDIAVHNFSAYHLRTLMFSGNNMVIHLPQPSSKRATVLGGYLIKGIHIYL